MKRFTKFAVGLALAASAATMLAAAPASAQPYGYAPRGAVCDPYSRFYDPYYCHGGYYGPGWGGPVIDFRFGGGFGRGWGGGHDFHGGGFGGHGGGHTGGGGHHH